MGSRLQRLSIYVLWAALIVFAAIAAPARAADGLRTVQDLLRADPHNPIHFVYLHGIRASAPGFSLEFRKRLCAHIEGGCTGGMEGAPHYLDLGERPPAAFLGDPVWKSPEAWKGSRPFVMHYVFRRPSGPPIIVDEVNYWPLLLPLKCQYLVGPDARLTGPDKPDIRTCANDEPDGRKPYLFPWFDPQQAQRLLATTNPAGRGAWINGLAKTSILNWGLSDAVIALGPMKSYTRLAVWCAFEEIADFDPQAPPTTWNSPPRSCKAADNAQLPMGSQFVVITESLGSFVLLDAFADAAFKFDNAGASAVDRSRQTGSALQFIVERSDNIYFFANQFALLELARLQGLPAYAGSQPDPSTVIVDAMRKWAVSKPTDSPDKQLVAFNDPSDLLTFDVPPFCRPTGGLPACPGVFTNIYVHNAFNWFGAYEQPVKAHTWYSRNEQVLKTVFGR